MTAVANLWPTDFVVRPTVLRPLTILKAQADNLSQLTSGLLVGDVTTVTGEDGFVLHRFDIVAQRLDGYRQRVLLVTHGEQYYPVVLEAECLKQVRTERVIKDLFGTDAMIRSLTQERKVGPRPWPDPDDWRPIAATQEAFEAKLREVFGSAQVRGAIESLIALINERQGESPGANENGEAKSE